MPQSKVKKYTKSTDRTQVKNELSQNTPMILRIHRTTCPACQMSEKPWQQFCKKGVPGFVILDIEETAVPPEMMTGIRGFPTYAIHDEHGHNRHHTGALMSPKDILKFVNTGAD